MFGLNRGTPHPNLPLNTKLETWGFSWLVGGTTLHFQVEAFIAQQDSLGGKLGVSPCCAEASPPQSRLRILGPRILSSGGQPLVRRWGERCAIASTVRGRSKPVAEGALGQTRRAGCREPRPESAPAVSAARQIESHGL